MDVHDATEPYQDRDERDDTQAVWPDRQSLTAVVLDILADKGIMASFVYLERSLSSSLFNLCKSGRTAQHRTRFLFPSPWLPSCWTSGSARAMSDAQRRSATLSDAHVSIGRKCFSRLLFYLFLFFSTMHLVKAQFFAFSTWTYFPGLHAPYPTG